MRGYIRRDRWPEGTIVTEKMILEMLKEWNPEYFEEGGEYMSRGNSIENDAAGIGTRTGIRVPMLREGDIVIYRQPIQSKYPED
jgi:hypothetical protein